MSRTVIVNGEHIAAHHTEAIAEAREHTQRPGIATQVEPMDTRTVHGRPGTATTVDTPQEWAVVAHLRGFCHNTTDCALCTAQNRAFGIERRLNLTQRVLDSIIEG